MSSSPAQCPKQTFNVECLAKGQENTFVLGHSKKQRILVAAPVASTAETNIVHRSRTHGVDGT
jgi:hypothetical protein